MSLRVIILVTVFLTGKQKPLSEEVTPTFSWTLNILHTKESLGEMTSEVDVYFNVVLLTLLSNSSFASGQKHII